ncbi:hypothetical protein ACWCP6_13700 [Streptomyces sp. NPDC002004]
MAIISATRVVAPRLAAVAGTAAVVAPYGSCTYAQAFARQGWRTVAVELDAGQGPSALGEARAAGAYADAVVHRESLRRTVKALRGLGVSAVVAGSAAGIELTERIAWQLGLPGGDPVASRLRYDRGAQAAALARAGIPAPRGIRTASLADALAWAETCRLPAGYTLSPAVAGVPVEPLACDREPEIEAAWPAMSRAASRHSGSGHLVLTERLSTRRFVVNSVSRPGAGGRSDHRITDVWAETHASGGAPDRTDLLSRHEPLTRSLSTYMQRALGALGVVCGPVTARVAHGEGRGPLLMSALAAPGMSFADEALCLATGQDRVTDVLDPWLPPVPARPVPAPAGHRVVRVHLRPAAGGGLDPRLGRVLRRLPTVVAVGDSLRPHDPVSGPAPCAEAVLSSTDAEAVEADYRVIRALEGKGLGHPSEVVPCRGP